MIRRYCIRLHQQIKYFSVIHSLLHEHKLFETVERIILYAIACACSIMGSKPALNTEGSGFDSRLSSGLSCKKEVTQVKNRRRPRVA